MSSAFRSIISRFTRSISTFNTSYHHANISHHLKPSRFTRKPFEFTSIWCNNLKNNMIPSVLTQYQYRMTSSNTNSKGIQSSVSSLQAKKRMARKRITKPDGTEQKLDEATNSGLLFNQDSGTVLAYATAEEYNLEKLGAALKKQGLYQPAAMPEVIYYVNDVLHVSAKYRVGGESRQIYFFREGSVVMWNVPDLEVRNSLLKFLNEFEDNSYSENLIQAEIETIDYTYTDNKTRLVNGKILLNSEGSTDLEKYTFSNAIALSVKLGLWEASLDRYVDSIEFVTEDMKIGKKITMSRQQVLRKMGELFALRHLINLSSDLLDTPDFYWDRENLEALYHKTCNHLNISKRTKVMNEKLNHCSELIQLLGDHLSDRHHVRLEIMIIVLIMVEVMFEILHYLEKVLSSKERKITFAVITLILISSIQQTNGTLIKILPTLMNYWSKLWDPNGSETDPKSPVWFVVTHNGQDQNNNLNLEQQSPSIASNSYKFNIPKPNPTQIPNAIPSDKPNTQKPPPPVPPSQTNQMATGQIPQQQIPQQQIPQQQIPKVPKSTSLWSSLFPSSLPGIPFLQKENPQPPIPYPVVVQPSAWQYHVPIQQLQPTDVPSNIQHHTVEANSGFAGLPGKIKAHLTLNYLPPASPQEIIVLSTVTEPEETTGKIAAAVLEVEKGVLDEASTTTTTTTTTTGNSHQEVGEGSGTVVPDEKKTIDKRTDTWFIHQHSNGEDENLTAE
uniref:DUF155 domain-containing protein n=1 Tax=Strigamia maritima TaxID=126957 RepID=T1J827_STRMM